MDLRLRNKHILITGGSRGIGRACVDAFLEEGAKVSVISRNASKLPDGVFHILADLSDAVQAREAVFKLIDKQGNIDVLVNCAGSAKKTPPEEVMPEHYRVAMDAKFYTYINVIEPVIKEMAKNGFGSIVNVIGLGGKVAVPTHLPGGSANAALLLTTAGYANVYIKKGIRINSVNPIATNTELLQSSLEADAKMNNISIDEALKAANNRTPLGRIIEPKEVADAVLFLSSDRASYINGNMLYLDGGMYPYI